MLVLLEMFIFGERWSRDGGQRTRRSVLLAESGKMCTVMAV